MRIRHFALAALSSVALLTGAGLARAEGPSIDDLLKDQDNPKSVLTNGLGVQGQRYSSLNKITRDNIKGLVPAWAFSFGGEKQRGQESQPIVYDGVIYVTASYSRVFALDAHTGERLWEYQARLPEGILPCCDVINRGVAILGDKVFFGTLDAKMVALNAKTGKVVWSKKIGDYEAGYSYSAAPLIVPSKRGPLLVTGLSGGEFGVVGRVDARNPENGELVWSRPVIEGHMGMLDGKPSTMTGTPGKTWPGEMYKTGGGATWLGGTYDPETNLIFFGTGNPAPWNSFTRPGDNLWSSSRLALDPDTGEIKWGFQTTPHDGWDFDGVNEFISFDLKAKDGSTTKAGATADRNGFFYVLDRTNGKFLRATPFVKNITWAKGIGADGRPLYNEESRPGDPSKTEPGKPGKSVFSVPSFLGGKNWMPMAYSKQTGLFYVPSNEWGMDIWNEPITYKKGAAFLGAGFTIKPVFDDHIGSLKAIDPATGDVKWEYKNKAPLWGGVLTTAGGLVFTGTPEGYLKAFDAKTGDELWKFNTGSGIVGSPVTWEQDGEQWVGVVSGWGGAVPLWGGEVAKVIKDLSQGGSMWAFKLPKTVAAK